jgi:outer membrane phospholipase A
MTSGKQPLDTTIPAPAPAPTNERNTPGTAKAASRSQRYQKALSEAQQLTLEEQQLELAELNFQRSVISNVIANNIPPSRTSRYKNTQTNFEEMSPEEQQLELAGLKFQISVMQRAIANRNGES